jgi:hypothetical protein
MYEVRVARHFVVRGGLIIRFEQFSTRPSSARP